jgi:serine/threonine protein kinase
VYRRTLPSDDLPGYEIDGPVELNESLARRHLEQGGETPSYLFLRYTRIEATIDDMVASLAGFIGVHPHLAVIQERISSDPITLDNRFGRIRLGQGSFGSVYLGHFKGIVVAVKVLNLADPDRADGGGGASRRWFRMVCTSALDVAKRTVYKMSRSAARVLVSGANVAHDPAPPPQDVIVSRETLEHFERELAVFEKCHHPNLMPLIAVSAEPFQPLCLVMPYLAHGALSQFFRNPRLRRELTWQIRVQIASGIAEGLRYLHEAVLPRKPAFAHLDLNSSNIVLDALFNPRISDFGTSLPLPPLHPPRSPADAGAPPPERNASAEDPRMFLEDPRMFLEDPRHFLERSGVDDGGGGGGRCCSVSKHDPSGFQSRGGGGGGGGGGIELSQMRTVAITVDPPHLSESGTSDDSETSDCSSSETALIFGDRGREDSQIEKKGSDGKKVSPATGIQQTSSSSSPPTLSRGQYGTYGYSDPQYMHVRQQEEEHVVKGGLGCLAALSADVFSFGVILLQVMDMYMLLLLFSQTGIEIHSQTCVCRVVFLC